MEGFSSEKKECELEGRVVPHGAEFCALEFCKICESGKFEIPIEQSLDSEDVLTDPAESYFVPFRP